MDDRSFSRMRLAGTACVAVAEWAFLAWQHAHGGVPSHHLLDRADMLAISNGWGALVLPALAWFLLGRVKRRVTAHGGGSIGGAAIGFFGALGFGVLLSVFFTRGADQVTGAMFEPLFPLALVVPIYRAEYLLGFVLGMAVTFGGVLPGVIGSLLAPVLWVIHRYLRTGLLLLGRRLVGRARPT